MPIGVRNIRTKTTWHKQNLRPLVFLTSESFINGNIFAARLTKGNNKYPIQVSKLIFMISHDTNILMPVNHNRQDLQPRLPPPQEY